MHRQTFLKRSNGRRRSNIFSSSNLRNQNVCTTGGRESHKNYKQQKIMETFEVNHSYKTRSFVIGVALERSLLTFFGSHSGFHSRIKKVNHANSQCLLMLTRLIATFHKQRSLTRICQLRISHTIYANRWPLVTRLFTKN